MNLLLNSFFSIRGTVTIPSIANGSFNTEINLVLELLKVMEFLEILYLQTKDIIELPIVNFAPGIISAFKLPV